MKVKLIRPLHHQKNDFLKDGQKIIENELVELYQAVCDSRIVFDKDEVAGGKFLTIEEISEMVKGKKVQFTPWFLDEWKFYLSQNPEFGIHSLIILGAPGNIRKAVMRENFIGTWVRPE